MPTARCVVSKAEILTRQVIRASASMTRGAKKSRQHEARDHSGSSNSSDLMNSSPAETDGRWKLPRLQHSSSSKIILVTDDRRDETNIDSVDSSNPSMLPTSPSSTHLRSRSRSSIGDVVHLRDIIDHTPFMDAEQQSKIPSFSTKMRKCCSWKMIKKRLPIFDWLPRTTMDTAICDVIAGLSVGLTVIPHAFAFAGLAGIPIEYGLYSAFVGCFVYLFLGTVKEITIGPTATQSLITCIFITNRGLPPQIAVSLCLMSGCTTLLMGLLNLGVLVNFMSVPITSAFTTAVAINIASTQIKAILGIKYRATGIINVMRKLFENIHQTNYWDAILGCCCITYLTFFRFLKPRFDPKPGDLPGARRTKKLLTLFCNAANAVVVLLTAVLAYVLFINNMLPFPITGDMPAGIPTFKVPQFGYNDTNGTYHGFFEVAGVIGEGIAVVPILAVLESISIAKAFAKGKAMDATQEMLAIGTSNILGAFVSSMPVTGTFSRTAINAASGVESPAGGVVTGAIVLVSLSFLTPCFKFIPVATLGAVVICAVIFVVDVPTVIAIWKTKKSDLLPYTATFFGCLLLEMHWGIILGLIAQVTLILLDYSKPQTLYQKAMIEKGHYAMVVKPADSILYPGMERFRATVLKKARSAEYTYTRHIIIDCVNITRADYSLKTGFESLRGDLKRMDRELHFLRLRPEVEKILFHDLDVDVVLQSFEQLQEIDTNKQLQDSSSRISSRTNNGRNH